jgi:hypothetical protein
MQHDDKELETLETEEANGHTENSDDETNEYVHIEWAGFI